MYAEDRVSRYFQNIGIHHIPEDLDGLKLLGATSRRRYVNLRERN
jgi:hypothetical protein